MLMIAYEGNTTYNIDKRIDIIEKIISYIKYLDYLINLCYDKRVINSKRYLKFGNSLDYLLKYVISWYKVSRDIKSRA